MNTPVFTFALVGAGEFGNFAESIMKQVPQVRLVAVVDTNEAAGRRLAKTYQAHIYSSLEDLFAQQQVDFVMINTPNDTHYDLIQTAQKHNTAAFCEKPLVIKKDQINELFLACPPGSLDVDMVLREASGYRYLREQVKEVGVPHHIHLENHAHESSIQSEWYWQEERSGGWFYTSAIHFIDIFYFLWPQLSFNSYRAIIDRDPVNGRAIGYEFGLRGRSTEISVLHRFDTVGREHMEASFAFENDTALLKGWVPAEIRWINNGFESFALVGDREIEYRKMVAQRVRGFLQGFQHKRWRIQAQELYLVSALCELMQASAISHPGKWRNLPDDL